MYIICIYSVFQIDDTDSGYFLFSTATNNASFHHSNKTDVSRDQIFTWKNSILLKKNVMKSLTIN